jgi:hypothetical protein
MKPSSAFILYWFISLTLVYCFLSVWGLIIKIMKINNWNPENSKSKYARYYDTENRKKIKRKQGSILIKKTLIWHYRMQFLETGELYASKWTTY